MSVHQKVRSYRMYRVSVVLAVSAVVVIMGNYLGLYNLWAGPSSVVSLALHTVAYLSPPSRVYKGQ
jgi:hypothetical protein